MEHLVLEDEVPDDLEELIAHFTDEVSAATEIEARLARRLAIAFWKGERAERIEVALFDAAPKIRPPEHGYQWEEADPLTTFDVRRFNAIRGQQAQIGREIRSCLRELRQLRKDALERTGEPEQCEAQEQNCPNDFLPRTSEPGDLARNEPENCPLPANDDRALATSMAAPPAASPPLQSEPDELLAPAVLALRVAIAAELAARRADPERDPAIMDGLMRDYWVARTGLPVLEAG